MEEQDPARSPTSWLWAEIARRFGQEAAQVRSHLEIYVEPANEHTRQQIQRLQAEGRLWNAQE